MDSCENTIEYPGCIKGGIFFLPADRLSASLSGRSSKELLMQQLFMCLMMKIFLNKLFRYRCRPSSLHLLAISVQQSLSIDEFIINQLRFIL
jgi:hypothetical protein